MSSRSASGSANWLSVHHGCPAATAAARTSSRSRKPDAPSEVKSIGAIESSPLPSAAVDHAASRNSRPVLIRSAARVRTFSGSHTSSGVPAGRCAVSGVSSAAPQHRHQRLHPVDRDARGQLGQHVPDAADRPVTYRGVRGEGGGPLTDKRRSAGTPGTRRRSRCRCSAPRSTAGRRRRTSASR